MKSATSRHLRANSRGCSAVSWTCGTGAMDVLLPHRRDVAPSTSASRRWEDSRVRVRRGVVMWALSLAIVVVVVLLAFVTAAVAEKRGQSGIVWFVAGLIAPVLALLLAASLQPVSSSEASLPSASEAARQNAVAQLLASEPGLPEDAVAERTGSTRRAVLEQLSALRSLGYAERDASGRWGLTHQGDRAFRS